MNDQFIKQMFNDLKKRKNINENKSYTAHLLNNPELLGKKNRRRILGINY